MAGPIWATAITKVEVRWPRPGVPPQVFTGLETRRFYRLVEGREKPEPLPLATAHFPTAPPDHEKVNSEHQKQHSPN